MYFTKCNKSPVVAVWRRFGTAQGDSARLREAGGGPARLREAGGATPRRQTPAGPAVSSTAPRSRSASTEQTPPRVPMEHCWSSAELTVLRNGACPKALRIVPRLGEVESIQVTASKVSAQRHLQPPADVQYTNYKRYGGIHSRKPIKKYQ